MGNRKVKFGVVVYPGTNCDRDTYHVIKEVAEEEAQYLWYKDTDLKGSQVVILPGGFSYGDYLRSGAIARFSPIMKAIREFAENGGLVLGICNGFQILLEAGLLPGAMLRNRGLRFICRFVDLTVENDETPFTLLYKRGEKLRIPIAHIDGNYFATPEVMAELEKRKGIIFRYVNNPNGSLHDTAGIINSRGNVLGLMPHPERASEALVGSTDGLRMFLSAAKFVRES
ncbi:MAG: phosphoribosylformylglycinamidine synthase subunit PurQ [Candidatus Aminicenantes bacterium]|nr:phosphoribosylformylglycinamidine synthase subunit PurQ [Candidatus Aminicenantes bacterium]